MIKFKTANQWQAALISLVTAACASQPANHDMQVPQAALYRPEAALGELFHDVQMARIFPDSKTFADYRPTGVPETILEIYRRGRSASGFDLAAFVRENFDPPLTRENRPPARRVAAMEEHIPSHWDYLTRQPGDEAGTSSLIPLPHPYVVPGGRFREIYYWDSYFTMLGLAASGRWDLVENMLDNFAWLIDTLGFIPNGNRTYFLGRSQPPFFSSMVMLHADHFGLEAATRYLPQLEMEYAFWMDGTDRLDERTMAYKRVVRPAPGVVLNRYWDDFAEPRPESYREDFELARGLDDKTRAQLFRDIRAACESGWDFSSRWFADGSNLGTINTTQILPVDLNSLLQHLESTIGLLHAEAGHEELAGAYRARSVRRAENIIRYFWDSGTGYYRDYNFEQQAFTSVLSVAGMYPFFFNIAGKGQIEKSVAVLRERFLFDGGLVATVNRTGQQWDSPNGWPPLQWIAIKGLSHYQQDGMALEIARRWLKLNQTVYSSTGKMMEKYDVTDLGREAGGGEYPAQDGFGWTNGVAFGLLQMFKGE